MDYDKLSDADKIAILKLAVKISEIHEPYNRQRRSVPILQYIKEITMVARDICEEVERGSISQK